MVQRHWEKIIEKVKEEKHITPLQLILELITFNMYKIKKKAWERCLLSSDGFSLIYTLFSAQIVQIKGGGEGGGEGSNRPMPHFLDKE